MSAALAEPHRCERCDNQRIIQSSWSKRRIRCPMCTRRRPDRSGKHLKAFTQSVKTTISGAEHRKMLRGVVRDIARTLIERVTFAGVPKHLATTDGILKRWAAASSGMPADDPDLYAKSRPPPLDDRTQEAVSDIIRASSPGLRKLIRAWYRTEVPTPILAKQWNLSPRQFIREWEACLVDLREKFRTSPHSDLAALVRQIP
jgi:hypothetical protein